MTYRAVVLLILAPLITTTATAQAFQADSAAAAIDIDGVLTDTTHPAITEVSFMQVPMGPVTAPATGTFTFSSNAGPGSSYEIVFNDADLVGLGAGGFHLFGEIVNLDTSAGLNGFNGGGRSALSTRVDIYNQRPGNLILELQKSELLKIDFLK